MSLSLVHVLIECLAKAQSPFFHRIDVSDNLTMITLRELPFSSPAMLHIYENFSRYSIIQRYLSDSSLIAKNLFNALSSRSIDHTDA